ncbi:SGNH/GDSL hydrolase family protein [Agromyces sp. NPDC055520]
MTAVFELKGRVIGSAAAAIIALVAIPLGIAGPANAAPPVPSPSSSSSSPVAKYVSLGDSVAAGQGAGGYVDACLRSPSGYPALLDAVPNTNLLRNPSCSGAKIADVAALQLSELNRGTTLVTITVGANEVDLPGILAACTAPSPPAPPTACQDALIAASTYLGSGELAGDLSDLIGEVAARSPRAEILVTGYAIPFAPGLSSITNQVNVLTFILNAQIISGVGAAMVLGANAGYVDVSVPFADHGVGTVDPWIGDLSDPVSFMHPNAAGYVAYRDAIVAALALP